MNSHIMVRMFFAVVFMLQILTLPVSAQTVTQTTTRITTTTIRDDAPIYMGPVVEMELEELTLDDFKNMGTKPSAARELYRQYRVEGEDPNDTTPRLYKMKVTRELTLVDFEGTDVAPELSKVRYERYVTVYKASANQPHYVYVYHSPVVLTVRY